MRSRSYGSRLHTSIHQLYSLCRSENQGIFTRERDFFSQALPCLQCLRGCFTFYLTRNTYRHAICLGNWKRDDLRNAHGNFVCSLPDAERVIMGQGAVAIRTLTSADNKDTGVREIPVHVFSLLLYAIYPRSKPPRVVYFFYIPEFLFNCIVVNRIYIVINNKPAPVQGCII